MVSVQEAKALIKAYSKALQPVTVPLLQGIGLTLAQDVIAPIHLPSFAQSAMDGYAISYAEMNLSNQFSIAGEIQAGSTNLSPLLPQTAARIFTGAPLPPGADTVVMQEKVTVENNRLVILDSSIRKGSNVKQVGTDIRRGELAISIESSLTPAAIGFLSAMGITEAKVYPKPSVAVIVTGKEIVAPGAPLHNGQVYDANSFAINAVLQQLNISRVVTIYTNDFLPEVEAALQSVLQSADLILLSGGISTGEHDLVLKATQQCGISEVFYKINQKPGKPLFFGIKDTRLVFGLPGNPGAALTCMYEYVLPAIEGLCAWQPILQTKHLPLTDSFAKPPGKAMFVKAVCTNDRVSILPAQESYKLGSFAQANCLVFLNENTSAMHEGDMVEVHLLPP